MELKRLDETKVLKDPVHSYIHAKVFIGIQKALLN